MGKPHAVKSVDYSGRLGDSDTTHGPKLLASLLNADLVRISDPLSFPWDLLDGNRLDCIFIIDIARCSVEDLTALTPAVSALTRYDVIVDSQNPQNPEAKRFGELTGAIGREPEIAATGRAKAMLLDEGAILERTIARWETLVVDYEDLEKVEWRAHAANGQHQMIAVRVPGQIIRSAANGFSTLARSIAVRTQATAMTEVWGIRPGPGQPLDRSVVVLSRGHTR